MVETTLVSSRSDNYATQYTAHIQYYNFDPHCSASDAIARDVTVVQLAVLNTIPAM